MRLSLLSSAIFAVICLVNSVSPAQKKPDIPVTDENVEKAIAKAMEYIFSRQRDDGSWPPFEEGQPPRQLVYKEGPTAMSIYALVASDKNLAKDSRITKALDWMARPDNQCKLTYSIAFRCLAWLTVNKYLDNKYMKQLTADVDAFVKAGKNGTYT
ncbi:MAG: hypothetical protein HZA50_13025 [Planctomycetes bacterium]|nr:hypothetical protein [Planctomycetota bacterium]